jgi:hypothetical protein
MYAQNPHGTDLPRNYSGNAFRYPPIRTEGGPPEGQGEVEAQTREALQENPAVEAGSALGERDGETTARHLSLPLFSGRGIGSEELLLLGLLLLLGGGEGQKDLMMCLLLLLFCG